MTLWEKAKRKKNKTNVNENTVYRRSLCVGICRIKRIAIVPIVSKEILSYVREQK